MPALHARALQCAACLVLLLLSLAATASTLERAETAWEASDVPAAVVYLKAAIDEDPDAGRARLLQARMDLALLNPAAAEDTLRRLLAAGAARAEVLPLLGDALLQQQRFQAVLEEISPAPEDPDALRSQIARIRAEALHALHRDAEASTRIETALALDPHNARAVLERALGRLASGDLDGARADAQHATDIDPKLALAWEFLGLLAQQSHDLAEAERVYSIAILSRHADWMPRYKRALVRIDEGKLDAAAQDIDAAAKQVPNFTGLAYARGRLALARGHSATALPLLLRYLEAVPTDIEASYFTAVTLLQLQRFDAAEDHLQRTLAAAPGAWRAALLLAELRLRAGDPGSAESLLRPLLDRPEAREQAGLLLVRALLAQGRGDETPELLGQLTAAAPNNGRLALAHAQRLAASGDSDGAIAELRRVITTAPKAKAPRLLLIRLLVQAGDTEAAHAEAVALADIAPRDAEAMNALAVTLALRGDGGAARALLRKSSAMDPGALEPALNLARLALADDDTATAREAIDGVLAADPGNTGAVLALAELLAGTGDTDGAAEQLADAVKAAPDNLALRLAAAHLLLRLQRPAAAEKLLQTAPAEQRDTPELLDLRGRLALADGRADEALSVFEDFGALRPEAAEPFYFQARALAALGRVDEARERTIRALRAAPDSPLALATLEMVLGAMPAERRQDWLAFLDDATGHAFVVRTADARNAMETGDRARASALLKALRTEQTGNRALTTMLIDNERQRGNPEGARAVAQDWLKDHPRDTGIQLAAADLALALNDTAAAVGVYEALLQHEPPLPAVHNNLAWLLRESDPARARQLAEVAHRLAPNEPDYADTLAVIALDAGEPNAALPLLQAAYQSRPTDASIAYHYARALAATGEPARARQVLLQIRAHRFPEQAAAIELLDRLQP